MNTITLSEAAAHVGQTVCFIAAVQHIVIGKKVIVSRRKVHSCHVLYVGDASQQFFRITCWGDTLPTLIHSLSRVESAKDLHPMIMSTADAMIRVGDIALFSLCRIKSYQGNIEAQYLLRNDKETAQLLYRNDLYFSTKDVSLLSLYPMIKWYKQYCREHIGHDKEKILTEATRRKNRSSVKDLRENMVVSVLCKLRPANNGVAGTTEAETNVVSEMESGLLCKLIMFDSAGDGMLLNLWDQYADKRFVARLLEHRGAVEIDGIFVSLQALSNRLLANTTSHTTFQFLDPDDRESIALEKNIVRSRDVGSTSSAALTDPTSFTTFQEFADSSFEGLATLKNVRIEKVCLGRHCGHEARVLAKFAPLLTERYCTGCSQTLHEVPCQDYIAQSRLGACANKCKNCRGSADMVTCAWRYCPFTMILRDSRDERLHAKVEHQTILEIVGQIEPQVLFESSCSTSTSSQFNAAPAVASLLNALVEDATQKFEAQLVCNTVRNDADTNLVIGSCQDSSLGDEQVVQRVFNLVSLIPFDVLSI